MTGPAMSAFLFSQDGSIDLCFMRCKHLMESVFVLAGVWPWAALFSKHPLRRQMKLARGMAGAES